MESKSKSTSSNQETGLIKKFFKISLFGIPMPLFLFGLVIIILGIQTKSLPKDMVGSLFLIFTCGIVLGKLGDSIPIWKDYLGGGAILAFLVMSWLVYVGLIPTVYVKNVKSLFSGGFLNLYISIMICGSLLSIDRKFLAKTIGGFIPMVLIATVTAGGFAVLGGLLTGVHPKDVILDYALPIMGGGNGAGAIPMSQIWGQVTGKDPKIWYSSAMAILTIANIIAIIAGALLNGIGNKKPELTGHGELIKGVSNAKSEKSTFKATFEDGAAGLFITLAFYCLANLFGKGFFPTIGGVVIHPFAYLVVFVLLANGFNLVPERIRVGAKQVQKFMVGNLFYVLIAGVGLALVDFGALIKAFNLTTVVISLFAVIGAILGPWLTAKVFGFYPIESAIAAGLCHVNRGGSGDLEILGAAKRMNLMAYAQIATRLGGALILVLAGVLFSIWL
ncbi:2-hydroxycarboxylate transporter family protein [Eubacterium multiforme]|uniref:Na+/citrate or Na+/malate symporter n=1 Tax=Eubacterium multiforme TaxID=83339 RepID=A0ABT9UVM6_9FIRM|nr:2-hydroxycarboxylate transporter family protein [Eubacterium multiforme]MDQ0150324.1 Na+/citrate or Na+/malate symporter [Eubacterium multiforme]